MALIDLTNYTMTRNTRAFVKTIAKDLKAGKHVAQSNMDAYKNLQGKVKISNNFIANIFNFFITKSKINKELLQVQQDFLMGYSNGKPTINPITGFKL